jgi:hypothetical protein
MIMAKKPMIIGGVIRRIWPLNDPSVKSKWRFIKRPFCRTKPDRRAVFSTQPRNTRRGKAAIKEF